MLRYRLLITFICLCIFYPLSIEAETNNTVKDYKLSLMYNDVIKIEVNVGGPSYSDHQKYNCTTSSQNEIAYILNYLNSFNLKDDGKTLYANDVSSYSINIYNTDSSITKYGFFSGRFYNDTNKQYAIESREYDRLLDFIYAIKTEKLILDSKVTFEPSGWARTDIEKAIENGLVPKWNQINYSGNITRLEVCQLIANFLDTKGYTDESSEANPFTDTGDKSVITLYHLKILNGKSVTQFCPYDFITREELARVLSNTYHYVNGETTLEDSSISYKDKDTISDWAVESVVDMTSLSILVGNENGEFEPLRNISKEEVIMTLLRLSGLR